MWGVGLWGCGYKERVFSPLPLGCECADCHDMPVRAKSGYAPTPSTVKTTRTLSSGLEEHRRRGNWFRGGCGARFEAGSRSVERGKVGVLREVRGWTRVSEGMERGRVEVGRGLGVESGARICGMASARLHGHWSIGKP